MDVVIMFEIKAARTVSVSLLLLFSGATPL
jgi:hypothetical protein